MRRRDFLGGLAGALPLALLASCKKEPRCKHCGMKLVASSAWYTELVTASGEVAGAFDTPRCAFSSWRSGETAAAGLRVREYYDAGGALRDGKTLRFVVGGDVTGPMGPDLVPIEPARVTKFIQDHAADRALTLDEVTPEALAALK